MIFGERGIDDNIEVTGKTIENEKKFEYLNSLLTCDENCSEEIKRQIGKAKGSLASLKHISDGKKLSVRNKFKVLNASVCSGL